MTGTLIKRLREQAGITSRAVAMKSGMSHGQISKVENGQQGLSVKTAEKLGEALGVDPMALMVAQGFDVMRDQAEKGQISPKEVATKGAQLLQLAHETPGLLSQGEFQRFVKLGQGIHELASKVATKARSRATTDTQALLGRDGVGRATKSAGGVRASYTNSIPTDSSSGYVGGGRPETEGISHPAVRALADAVLSLEQDISNGTISGHGILGAVGNVLNSFEQEAVEADKAAAGEWLKRLKKLTSDAAQGIGTTTATRSADSQALAGRDALGRARTKRYGA